jgi:hypothetical protein
VVAICADNIFSFDSLEVVLEEAVEVETSTKSKFEHFQYLFLVKKALF